MKGINQAILLTAMLASPLTNASELFGVSGDGAGVDPESLFSVSTVNASTIFIHTLGNGSDGESIAFNPDDGLMYHWSGYVHSIRDTQIMETIDLDVQTVIDIPADFTFYNPSEVRGSTFDPISGNFLFTDYNENLSSATPGGIFLRIGPTDMPVRGLAFNGGRLYGGEHGGARLSKLDPGTGKTITTVRVVLNGFDVRGINGLTTDPSTGTLYAIIKVGGRSRRLVTLDPATGVATDVGPLPHGFANIEFRITNLPPVADAGRDQLTVECGGPKPGCALVTLDGSASSDPDGDALTYTWQPGGFTGAIISPLLDQGLYTFELTVDDKNGGTDTDTVTIKVVDTTAPDVSAELVPIHVKHKTGTFEVKFSCQDGCDEFPEIASATLNDIPVVDGQIVKLKLKREKSKKSKKSKRSRKSEKSKKSKRSKKHEVLSIEGPSFELRVVCTDAEGNSTAVTASPEFKKRSKKSRR